MEPRGIASRLAAVVVDYCPSADSKVIFASKSCAITYYRAANGRAQGVPVARPAWASLGRSELGLSVPAKLLAPAKHVGNRPRLLYGWKRKWPLSSEAASCLVEPCSAEPCLALPYLTTGTDKPSSDRPKSETRSRFYACRPGSPRSGGYLSGGYSGAGFVGAGVDTGGGYSGGGDRWIRPAGQRGWWRQLRVCRLSTAAELGLKACYWQPPPLRIRQRMELYAETRSKLEGRPFSLGEDQAVMRSTYVASSMEEARRDAEAGIMSSFIFNDPFRGRQVFTNPGEELSDDVRLDWDFLEPRTLLVGSPDHVVEKIQELREVCSLDCLLVEFAHGGIPQRKILRNLENFATRVMPALHWWRLKAAHQIPWGRVAKIRLPAVPEGQLHGRRGIRARSAGSAQVAAIAPCRWTCSAAADARIAPPSLLAKRVPGRTPAGFDETCAGPRRSCRRGSTPRFCLAPASPMAPSSAKGSSARPRPMAMRRSASSSGNSRRSPSRSCALQGHRSPQSPTWSLISSGRRQRSPAKT